MSLEKDEDFIGYCRIHSETPRALFHRRDVIRILRLAGAEETADHYEQTLGPDAFMAVHDDEMHPLCDMASENLRQAQKELKERIEKQQHDETEEVLFERPDGS